MRSRALWVLALCAGAATLYFRVWQDTSRSPLLGVLLPLTGVLCSAATWDTRRRKAALAIGYVERPEFTQKVAGLRRVSRLAIVAMVLAICAAVGLIFVKELTHANLRAWLVADLAVLVPSASVSLWIKASYDRLFSEEASKQPG